MTAAFLAHLHRHWPPERLFTDKSDCYAYAYDNSRRVALPEAVVMATSDEEVQQLVQLCRQHRVPLTVRGRGTNTTGASVPVRGGVVLSLERMNKILRFSPADRLIEVEAGCLNSAVQKIAASAGLFWPPDPTSAGFSSIGGNIACGSGGPKAVKYGTARDHLLGLSAVAGTGDWLHVGANTTKCVVGYDFTRLLCGSEGTLAVITRATLKLSPLPEGIATLAATFATEDQAVHAVARVMQAHTPRVLEFFDEQAVALAQAERDCGLTGAGALLLIEVDGLGLDQQIEALKTTLGMEASVRVAQNPAEADNLWAARKALSPALRKLAPKKVNEDVAVPVSRLPELLAGIKGIARSSGLRIVCFGHAGNGNLHVNILANPDDPAQMQAIDSALSQVFKLTLGLGGTISGEHGVGLVKREFVSLEVPAATLQMMRLVKQVFDPEGILNPDKTLPA